MASTEMTRANPLTLEMWSKKDFGNLGPKTMFGYAAAIGAINYCDKFIGYSNRGDEMTYHYVQNPGGTGIPGDRSAIEGNEIALDLGSRKISIDEVNFAMRSPAPGTISQQRTYVEFLSTMRDQAAIKQAQLLDTSFFNQAAGSLPNTFSRYGVTFSGSDKRTSSGCNTVEELSSDRIYRVGGAANDESLTSADILTTRSFDLAFERMQDGTQPIQPCSDGMYHAIISFPAANNLRATAGSDIIAWAPQQLAYRESGMKDDLLAKSITHGMRNVQVLGQYNNFVIHAAYGAAVGVNSATNDVVPNVSRTIILGKGALTFASTEKSSFSAESEKVPLKYSDDVFNYGKDIGINSTLTYGLKRNKPSNGSDEGAFVISHWSARNN